MTNSYDQVVTKPGSAVGKAGWLVAGLVILICGLFSDRVGCSAAASPAGSTSTGMIVRPPPNTYQVQVNHLLSQDGSVLWQVVLSRQDIIDEVALRSVKEASYDQLREILKSIEALVQMAGGPTVDEVEDLLDAVVPRLRLWYSRYAQQQLADGSVGMSADEPAEISEIRVAAGVLLDILEAADAQASLSVGEVASLVTTLGHCLRETGLAKKAKKLELELEIAGDSGQCRASRLDPAVLPEWVASTGVKRVVVRSAYVQLESGPRSGPGSESEFDSESRLFLGFQVITRVERLSLVNSVTDRLADFFKHYKFPNLVHLEMVQTLLADTKLVQTITVLPKLQSLRICNIDKEYRGFRGYYNYTFERRDREPMVRLLQRVDRQLRETTQQYGQHYTAVEQTSYYQDYLTKKREQGEMIVVLVEDCQALRACLQSHFMPDSSVHYAETYGQLALLMFVVLKDDDEVVAVAQQLRAHHRDYRANANEIKAIRLYDFQPPRARPDNAPRV